MFPLALYLALAAPAPTWSTPLAVYNGSWTVTAEHPFSGKAGAPDQLINHCTTFAAYVACEQNVNGTPAALVIFTPGDSPGHLHTQNVLPSGYAAGRGDLTIDGSHWTYLGKSTEGATTTWFRTENIVKDNDHIHFDQFSSTDNTTWTKTNQGDEVRTAQ